MVLNTIPRVASPDEDSSPTSVGTGAPAHARLGPLPSRGGDSHGRARMGETSVLKRSRSSLLQCALGLALCAACAAPPPDNRWSTILPEGVFFFEFDNDGDPVDPAEFYRARRELETGELQKLLVLSLGWSYDRGTSLQAYRDLLVEYLEWLQLKTGKQYVVRNPLGATKIQLPEGLGIVCVVWDSRMSGVTTLLEDLIPGATFTDVVGYVPDHVLFPFTFWAKAGKANRISYSLVRYLDALLNDLPAEPPSLYMIGHSFGCRVINTVVDSARPEPSSGHLEFKHGSLVKAALYIQPAMTYGEIPRKTSMPVVVTQTRHDHANGLLFTTGNIIGNTLGMESWLFLSDRYKRQDVDEQVARLFGSSAPEETQQRSMIARVSEAASDNLLTRFLAEVGGMTLGLVTSIPIAVFSWGRGQVYELSSRHLNYPFDTLAQIPLIEGLLGGFDRHVLGAFGWQQNWGVRHKGLFDFGPLVESAGRMDYPGKVPLQRLGADAVASDSEIAAFDFQSAPQPGVHFLRAEAVIHTGWSDYNNIAADASYGFLDLVGAHNDYHKTEVYSLVHTVMSQ